MTYHLPIAPTHPVTLPSIPRQIWQIWAGSDPPDDLANIVGSWQLKNQDSAYTLLSDDGANAFVRRHYAHRPEIRDLFLGLRLPVFRSDLLRYLLLETLGGVYSDLDVACKKPINQWIPDELEPNVRMVVGIEIDGTVGKINEAMPEPIQLCQWTIAASPNHPVLKKAVSMVTASLQAYAEQENITYAEIDPKVDDEVIAVTGPVIWTRAVMSTIGEILGENVSYLNFTGMKEPRLFGDVLVLPVDGFATGQSHSGATNNGVDPPIAMVRHLWKGSWKHQW